MSLWRPLPSQAFNARPGLETASASAADPGPARNTLQTIDYEPGDGVTSLKYDVLSQGPATGLRLKF